MEKDLQKLIYDNSIAFAKNLKLEREASGLSKREMAKLMGIAMQSYWAYENGLSLPTTENLLKLCHILDISLDDLFEITPKK